MSGGESADWPDIVDRVVDGDRVAFLEISRLITRLLSSMRAFDFRDDWDDVIQEVVVATVEAVRNQKLDDRAAVLGYIRNATRNKFVDRIRRRKREAPDVDAAEHLDHAVEWPPRAGRDLRQHEVWEFVRGLPENQQQVLLHVYVEGQTYEEAAQATGIPLGSLKRYLRQALATLHQDLAEEEVVT